MPSAMAEVTFLHSANALVHVCSTRVGLIGQTPSQALPWYLCQGTALGREKELFENIIVRTSHLRDK
jgi:hypothetical protein